MSIPSHDATVARLHRLLDRVAQQTAVTGANLANVDTPGYRARQIVFDDAMQHAQLGPAKTHARHLGEIPRDPAAGMVVDAPVTRMRNDGNTVDVDREMTAFAALQGRYSATTEMIRKRFALIEYAATEGGSR